jgi:hypothetical protein
MFSFFTEHWFMPCADCGASIERTRKHLHVCDPDRRLEYELFQLRREIAAFDQQLAEFVASPIGRFETWLAERDRRRRC